MARWSREGCFDSPASPLPAQNLSPASGAPQQQQDRKIEDNHSGAARGYVTKHTKRDYRQYMNRRGGFNKPLKG